MAHCKHRVMDKCKKDGSIYFNYSKCFEAEEEKKITNADKIRYMSDEELAEFAILHSKHFCDKKDKVCNKDGSCVDCAFRWLKSEPES